MAAIWSHRGNTIGCRHLAMGWLGIAILCFASVDFARAEQNPSPESAPIFLGAQSCSSTSCHGGAGNNKQQYTIWTKYDFHHARPYATLETPRAERLAQVLKLGDATLNQACTVCHAPFQSLPTGQFAQGISISEGISCESCHGSARNWLRSHTRQDWTHANRVQAGMRDLKNLYVRANVCVACHQNLRSGILAAGHPELIFELDGQAVSQPKHWRKDRDKPGAQIWLVGQAVALREISWQLAQNGAADPQLAARWAGLVWVLKTVSPALTNLPQLELTEISPSPERLETVRRWSDQFAKAAADFIWSEGLNRRCLELLSQTSGAFQENKTSQQIQARRAERLVLALDRISGSCSDNVAATSRDPILNRLFQDAQSLPDFDPQLFAKDLQPLHASVSGMPAAK